MRLAHLALALLVVAVWGCNFIFIKFGLEEIPPILLCVERFVLASIPAVFFMKRPAVPFRVVLQFGLIMFALQFTLLFMGMSLGMPPGLTSLLLQTQIFFSIGFAVLFLGELPSIWQIIGALTAFGGILIVMLHLGGNLSASGFCLVLAAAAAWGTGNLVTKKAGKINMLALVVWGSFIAWPPLLLLSFLIEGSDHIFYSLQHMSLRGVSAVLYITFASTWFGYGVWNWLLSKYPIASVAPFTLLVPVFGMLSAVLVLGEPLQSWKILAGMLVITGLCINLLGSRFFQKRTEILDVKALKQE